ncbi:MAG: glycerophosphodiester phosphodiesterase [Alphaproteobacteria bacterium]|nr:glycerophosphodiester phosphodiesterase [Alphaproteobacteria bacterium]
MFKTIFWTLATLIVAVAAAAVLNASFWSNYRGQVTLLAHRGMSQTFSRDGLTNTTCTAKRIHPPTHRYLENTIASMKATFAAGADIVEFDVHPTTDGHFAVFHDWTVDCRTNGHGVTREHTLAELKALDIGYGYTADNGKTFPFRGRGIGLMPSLDEVLANFPDKRFLINVKSNDPHEGDLLADRLTQLPPAQRSLLMAYGGDKPIERLHERIPSMRVMSRKSLLDCGLRYIAIGWSGTMPDACRDTIVLVPVNMSWLVWGWPNLFLERMHAVGSEAFVVGAVALGETGTPGIDSEDDLVRLPSDYSGGIWTNRIELIAPRLKPGVGFEQ